MNTTSESRPILVTGGTGKTGRRVAARLTAAGRPVRIGSRQGQPPFDWHDPATWGPALDGTAAAYLAYSPDIGFAGAADIVGDVARTAVDAGVRRLVLLSGRGEEGAERAERLVQASGRRLDDRAGGRVRPELHRGRLRRQHRRGRPADAGRRHRRAVHRRRRHRRRRHGCAARRSTHRPAVRGHRPPPADVHRGPRGPRQAGGLRPGHAGRDDRRAGGRGPADR